MNKKSKQENELALFTFRWGYTGGSTKKSRRLSFLGAPLGNPFDQSERRNEVIYLFEYKTLTYRAGAVQRIKCLYMSAVKLFENDILHTPKIHVGCPSKVICFCHADIIRRNGR